MPRGVYQRKPKEKKPPKTLSVCIAKGCDLPANRVKAGLCEKHYMRVRRVRKESGLNTPLDVAVMGRAKPPQERRIESNGYWCVYCPEHPLAVRRGAREEREHRVIYYDAHGEGPFSCHWCAAEVSWETLHIDHLDDDKANNTISNLVASCAKCNKARGLRKTREWTREKRTQKITHGGETKTIYEWCLPLGISATSLRARLKNGWDMDRALTEKRGSSGPPSLWERVEATPRGAMGSARRIAVWEACDRKCAICKTPVRFRGGTVIDHILPLELGGSDKAENLQILCTGCDRQKTASDIKRISKMRRQAKMHEGKLSRIQSRGFQKDLVKGFDGIVRQKEKAR